MLTNAPTILAVDDRKENLDIILDKADLMR
jgi:hypothetical protein